MQQVHRVFSELSQFGQYRRPDRRIETTQSNCLKEVFACSAVSFATGQHLFARNVMPGSANRTIIKQMPVGEYARLAPLRRSYTTPRGLL